MLSGQSDSRSMEKYLNSPVKSIKMTGVSAVKHQQLDVHQPEKWDLSS